MRTVGCKEGKGIVETEEGRETENEEAAEVCQKVGARRCVKDEVETGDEEETGV